MNEEISINMSIQPTWSMVRKIQERAKEFMKSKGKDKDATEAMTMCVTELIENAVKYGMETPEGGDIEAEFLVHDNTVFIKVINGIRLDSDIKNFIEHIEKIKNTDDPASLYTSRLMELMENPRPGESQLGLYRIAYEGEFKLDYKYENKVLTVFAEKNL
ncbi:MAG: hypothetical protein GY754_11355 [bacterium]|nr:hypothetical protein [bacterium]